MLMMHLQVAQLKRGHPIAVLAYAQRDLPSSALIRQIPSQSAVKNAGHRFQFIDDSTKLDNALKRKNTTWY